MLPLAILAYALWHFFLAWAFFGGTFQGGLTWMEGTAEAVSLLMAALIAPGRKRAVALAALAFYTLRNLAVLLFAPGAATPTGAASTIALAVTATAIVFALTKRSGA